MSITITESPPVNFDHTAQQYVKFRSNVQSGNDNILVRIDGETTQYIGSQYGTTCNFDIGNNNYDCTITLPANTMGDNLVYSLILWNTGGAASVKLDTRPAGT